MSIVAQAPAAATLTVASGAAYSPFLVASGEPGAGTQVNLNAQGSSVLNGKPFRVKASGYMTCSSGTYTSAATPIQFALFGSNTASFAAASGNALWSTTALAIFTVSSSTAKSVAWEIDASLVGDSASKAIVGYAIGTTGTSVNSAAPVITDIAAIAQSPTTLNFATEPPIQFAAGVISASANLLDKGSAPTTVTLTNFTLER